MAKINATGKIKNSSTNKENFGLYTKNGEDFAGKIISWYCVNIENRNPLISKDNNHSLEVLSSLLERIELIDNNSLSDESLEKICTIINPYFKKIGFKELNLDLLKSFKYNWEERGRHVSFYDMVSPLVPGLSKNVSDISNQLQNLSDLGIRVFASNIESEKKPEESQGFDIVVSSWKGDFTKGEHIEITINGNGFNMKLENLLKIKDREEFLKDEIFHGKENNYAEIIDVLEKLDSFVNKCNYNNAHLNGLNVDKEHKEEIHYELRMQNEFPLVEIFWNGILINNVFSEEESYSLNSIPSLNFENKKEHIIDPEEELKEEGTSFKI